MMKKILLTLLTSALVFLSGCNENVPAHEAETTPQETFFIETSALTADNMIETTAEAVLTKVPPPSFDLKTVPFENKTPETELAESFVYDYLAFHQKHNEETAIDLDKYFAEGNLKEFMGLMTELNIKRPRYWSSCYNKSPFIINELNTISHEEKNGVHEVYVYYSVSMYETDIYDPDNPEKNEDWSGYGRTAAFQIEDGKIINFDMEDVVFDENGEGRIVLPDNNPWEDPDEAESRIQSVKKGID